MMGDLRQHKTTPLAPLRINIRGRVKLKEKIVNSQSWNTRI